jgi:glyoxylase-like metal-dependent hydrolase (beta-lactamase superfamily II)
VQVVKETDHLFRLTRFGMVNCFLVREDDGLTLVDADLPGSADSILYCAKEIGSPIRRILLTHAHFDHTGAADDLMRATKGLELLIGSREARLLAGDLSLETGETGRKLFGFVRIDSQPTRLLKEGDHVGSLRAIRSPGHTPGHRAFLDERDNSLLAGDAFTTQPWLLAAGVFSPVFPLAALFSWNATLGAESAAKLRLLNPSRLSVGHGTTLVSPLKDMDRAVELALKQHPPGNQQ